MSELHPLSIFLVESGSKGDRLLFRYPYLSDENLYHVAIPKAGRYSAPVSEDVFSSRPVVPSSIKHHTIVEFSDKLLSNLCTVQQGETGVRFEVKVSDVRFVGHPTAVRRHCGHWLPQQQLPQQQQQQDDSTVHRFHIVFAVSAEADCSVVDCYHNLSYQLAIAVNHEEFRCRYLTRQALAMIALLDEYSSRAESCQLTSAYHSMIEQCQLAAELQSVYDSLIHSGTVQVSIGGWVDVSFALPHKIHKLSPTGDIIEPRRILQCLSLLRSYHTLLLLVPEHQLLRQLRADSSPALRRLVRTCSAIHNLSQLAADADITLRHVFQLVGHLVYWAKATVIYPLCERNVYGISPRASLSLRCRLSGEFAKHFPGHCLHTVLAQFSQPCSVSSIVYPGYAGHTQRVRVEMLVWLLQRRLLVQLHMFVFFTPNGRLPDTRSSPDVGGGGRDAIGGGNGSDGGGDGDGVSGDGGDGQGSSSADDNCLSQLSERDRACVMKVAASKHASSLALFARLLPYFDGCHHVEEMMHTENVSRLHVQRLLEQFGTVLTLCHKTDRIATHFS